MKKLLIAELIAVALVLTRNSLTSAYPINNGVVLECYSTTSN